MAQNLSNITFHGVTTMGSAVGSDYSKSWRIGAGTPAYATGLEYFYAAGVAEFASLTYLRAGAFFPTAGAPLVLTSGTNIAAQFGVGYAAGAVESAYLTFNTLSGFVSVERKLQFAPASGIWNAADSSILATEQEKWVRFAVSADSGAAGMGRIRNTFGTTYAITDAIINVKGVSTGVSHINAGVTSGAASTVGDLFDSVSVTAAGGHYYAISAGTSGTSGAPVTWATNHYLNITASAAGTPGGGSFSGTIMLKIKRLE
jgi:hypothetical protein